VARRTPGRCGREPQAASHFNARRHAVRRCAGEAARPTVTVMVGWYKLKGKAKKWSDGFGDGVRRTVRQSNTAWENLSD
jgi:hypothetical protein